MNARPARKVGDSALIEGNQIGTVTGTREAGGRAVRREAGFRLPGLADGRPTPLPYGIG